MRLSKNAMDVNRVGILNSLSTPGTRPSQTGYQLDNALLFLLRSFLVKRLSFLRLNSTSACKSGSLLILELLIAGAAYSVLDINVHFSQMYFVSKSSLINSWFEENRKNF